MMLQSILGDALALGSHASAVFKPVVLAVTNAVTSTVGTATSVATGTIATATSVTTSTLATPTLAPLTAITPVEAATATPIAAATGGGGLKLNPFDWNWITDFPNPALGIFGYLFVLICIIVFVAALYCLLVLRPRYRDTNTLNYRVIGKYAPWFLTVSGLGLFFTILRLPLLTRAINGVEAPAPFEFGGQRIWFYLILIALIGVTVWFFRYYPAKYRVDLENWKKRAVKRQYDPATIRRTGATVTPGGSPTGLKRRTRR